MDDALSLHLADEAATEALGTALAATLRPGMIIFLRGGLGAGKSTLARGVLRALGVSGAVKSPTYTIVETYRTAALPINHFDFYRLRDPQELEEMGIRDYLQGEAACLIEWPERAAPLLAAHDLAIDLHPTDHGASRRARVSAASDAGRAVLQYLREHRNDKNE